MIRLTIDGWLLLGGIIHLLDALFFLGLFVALWYVGDHANDLTAAADLAIGTIGVWCLREGATLTWSAFR